MTTTLEQTAPAEELTDRARARRRHPRQRPTRVTDGIELSDDPVLHIRTHLYGESARRRSGVERPTTLR